MAVKIRVGGKAKSEDKPAAKRSTRTSKPAAKAKPAKRSSKRQGTAPAATRGTPRATPKASNGDGPVRRASKGVDPRTEARLLKLVEKAGDRRRKAEIEHKESIDALHAAALEAIQGGVSMAKIADSSGISRQWLYKMSEFGEGKRESLTSGNGKAAKAAPAKRSRVKAADKPAKPATRRRTTSARSTGSKRTTTRKPAKGKPAPTSRRRVSIRSKG